MPSSHPLPIPILAALALSFSAWTATVVHAESQQQPPPKLNQCVTEAAPDKKCQLIVFLIYDESCKTACTIVKPIVKDLAAQNRIQYEELNTSPAQLQASMDRAKKFFPKGDTFVSDRTDEVPVVGIFTTKGKRLKEIPGRKPREVYQAAIDKALQKVAEP